MRRQGSPWAGGLGYCLFPYYGDVLDRLVKESRVPTSSEAISKGDGGDPAFQEFMRSALEEIQVSAGIADEEVRQKFGTEHVLTEKRSF